MTLETWILCLATMLYGVIALNIVMIYTLNRNLTKILGKSIVIRPSEDVEIGLLIKHTPQVNGVKGGEELACTTSQI